jgi:hypothetical protein
MSTAAMLDELSFEPITAQNASQHDSSLRLAFLNEDFFEIKLVKKARRGGEGQSVVKQAGVSLTDSEELVRNIDVNLESIDDIDPEWDALLETAAVADLNKMSRKDYILNFASMVAKDEDEKDSDEEKDECDNNKNSNENEDDEEDKENSNKVASKFDTLPNVEKQKFQKNRKSKAKAANVINKDIKIDARIDEEPEKQQILTEDGEQLDQKDEEDLYDENDDLSDAEKDYLRSQAKSNSKARNQAAAAEAVAADDEGEHDELAESNDAPSYNENNSSSSLTSSTNDGSMFGSLNDSSSFLKLKVGHFFIFYFINVF